MHIYVHSPVIRRRPPGKGTGGTARLCVCSCSCSRITSTMSSTASAARHMAAMPMSFQEHSYYGQGFQAITTGGGPPAATTAAPWWAAPPPHQQGNSAVKLPFRMIGSSGDPDPRQHEQEFLESSAAAMAAHHELQKYHGRFELGALGQSSMVFTRNAIADQSYGAYYHPFYEAQALHGRVLLPPALAADEPVYVNAKQFNGILRRRLARAKEARLRRGSGNRKPYLHESRHLHALRRARGTGGRFLNTRGLAAGASPRGSEREGNGSSKATRQRPADAVQDRQQDVVFLSSLANMAAGDGDAKWRGCCDLGKA
ncbi:hypothetical protein BS78_02G038400 [Paspalum vaginatum]|nr:hypothetical protein BS78_02G038400 [Paspalum vaginatum]